LLKRLVIRNFRQFEYLNVEFDPELNIVVGDNDAGKSTILQAIELALSSRIGGRPADGELSPHWFPRRVANQYLTELQKAPTAKLPAIVIEAYLRDEPHLAERQGTNNSLSDDCPGVRLVCAFDSLYEQEYKEFVEQAEQIYSIPVEFYRILRYDFAGEAITGYRLGVQCAVIDSSALRLQSGTDYYLRKTIDEHLSDDIRARMSLALRAYKERLARDEAFLEANDAIAVARNTLHKRAIRLAPDSSSKSTWESGIVPHLDEIPFGYVGKGEQAAFKTLLALDRDTKRDVVLVEEPENHLSYASLNALIQRIRERTAGKQLILTTHSSFVLNKLGIHNLRLLKNSSIQTFKDLPDDTRDYFYKLSGYDTLRLVLARAAILVEGPSDELIVQKAYLQKFGRLPIADGIDVISVQALAFRRFLELGKDLQVRIAVVTDLDSDESDETARKRFSDFEISGLVQGFVGKVSRGRTLEPQLLAAAGGQTIADALGIPYISDDDVLKYMAKNKTDAALKLFNHSEHIPMPEHIEAAVEFAVK
jgi:putative ATP-dependent endonuclease of OLD family